ncbi:anthranilate phosphoribosyltransferase [Actinomyces sp. 186855]|uniref:anthranilate phosphoribosyltransferase n=2 Tax=unclassified Actinomyces TaxID=2609248 RepID=UPI002A34FA27|nr:anthranilate phosphoribosyltransferase [Actinomyces sp. AC-20-1]MCL3788880.1 anthranilate phosphoribosyltransferase [Actinomyces sp. 187325]MCL3791014.1 anthranilate phosphoribosyltransferase [Actinomyces sp. 186855]MCL3793460.1 anthranilate phosphoribosyltransferase [Actinomyces sp. 217892]
MTTAPAENNAMSTRQATHHEQTEAARVLVRSTVQGRVLSYEEASAVFAALGAGLLSEVETAALLAAMHARGESAEEVAGAAHAFRAAARPFPEVPMPLLDIVGTGGDGVGTINISTGAGITAASMGLAVSKHGNRAVSSRTGAADVVGALGLPLELSPEQSARALEEVGFTFLFAQAYHPAMRFVAPVRAALRTPTVFNLLGPLINPARLSHQVVGVSDPAVMDMTARSLRRLGRERALVIHGLGLDEITVHGATTVREVTPEGVRSFTVTPEELGVPTRDLSEMLGGKPAENAQVLRDVFENRGRAGHRDAIAVNTGALLYLAGRVDTLREGTEAALEQLASGRVAEHLERMVAVSAPADEAVA